MNLITNLRRALAFCALLPILACATTQGEETEGIHFEHGDWEVACDNTLTCRIAGYCAGELHDQVCGSVLMTRAAGPNAPLEGRVTLADYDGSENEKPQKFLALWIDGKSKGALQKPEEGDFDFALTAAQIQALLVAARRDGVIEFIGDTRFFTLSGKGVSAVLLKADAIQGRIGTPGAFIRKGDKPEESVFPPRPVPIIRAVKVGKAPSRKLTAPEFATLKPLLLQSMKENNCWEDELEAAEKAGNFTLTPLNEGHALISKRCWMAAYNEGYAYWVTDSALKNPPQLVTRMGDHHDGGNGEIYARHKGRGLGDCWAGADWVWDGKAFRLAGEWTSGQCRLIHAGGAWHLPTFVADVVYAAEGEP
jgi:hypothetical protein